MLVSNKLKKLELIIFLSHLIAFIIASILGHSFILSFSFSLIIHNLILVLQNNLLKKSEQKKEIEIITNENDRMMSILSFIIFVIFFIYVSLSQEMQEYENSFLFLVTFFVFIFLRDFYCIDWTVFIENKSLIFKDFFYSSIEIKRLTTIELTKEKRLSVSDLKRTKKLNLNEETSILLKRKVEKLQQSQAEN